MNWLQMSTLIILANYFLQLFSDSDKTDLEKDIEDLEKNYLILVTLSLMLKHKLRMKCQVLMA